MKITLCGSARFELLFRDWDERLTLAGHLVYNLAVYPRDHDGVKNWYNEDQKTTLDLAHLAKIEESDAIVVINGAEGYIGDSTRREIEWAKMRGKLVFYQEPFTNPALAVDELLPGGQYYRGKYSNAQD